MTNSEVVELFSSVDWAGHRFFVSTFFGTISTLFRNDVRAISIELGVYEHGIYLSSNFQYNRLLLITGKKKRKAYVEFSPSQSCNILWKESTIMNLHLGDLERMNEIQNAVQKDSLELLRAE